MKSIKPGRQYSKFSGFVAVGAAVFGLFWTVLALGFSAYFMIPFGIIFIVIAVANAVFCFKNATSEKRYSVYDITDEEDEIYGGRRGRAENYCPYCGCELQSSFKYCPSCGREKDNRQ